VMARKRKARKPRRPLKPYIVGAIIGAVLF
jgi:hypothetical protein